MRALLVLCLCARAVTLATAEDASHMLSSSLGAITSAADLRPRQHAHTPARAGPDMASNGTAAAAFLHRELAGTPVGDALDQEYGKQQAMLLLADGEVGLSAKFTSGKLDATDRFFVCTHKCAVAARCPPLRARAQTTRKLVSALRPPPLVKAWLNILDKELSTNPDDLPEVCVGAGAAAGKLYLGATHAGGVGHFPDLPLSRQSSLWQAYPELNSAADAEGATSRRAPPPHGEGELFSIEWRIGQLHSPAEAHDPKVALRRYHVPVRASPMDILESWARAVKPLARPAVLTAAWKAVAEAKLIDAAQLVSRTVPYDPSVEDRPPPLLPTTVAVRPTAEAYHRSQGVGRGSDVARTLLPAQRSALLHALAPLIVDESLLRRAAAWGDRAEVALAGRPYICNVAQLSVSPDGEIVVAMYYMAVKALSQRSELETPKEGAAEEDGSDGPEPPPPLMELAVEGSGHRAQTRRKLFGM